MIGSATVRESRFAWSREKRRQRAAARVTPLRETPGASAAAWAMPSAEAVDRGRLAAPAPLRPACRRRASRAAPASSPTAVARGPPRRRSIWRSKA